MLELNDFETNNVSGGSFSSGEQSGEAAGQTLRKAFDADMAILQIGKWLGLFGEIAA